MSVNIKNLTCARNFLVKNKDTISPDFDMGCYEKSVLGHISILDPASATNDCWSDDFFGFANRDNYALHHFLFGGDWGMYHKTNTLDQAIKRIDCVIEHGREPDDWNHDFHVVFLTPHSLGQ